MKSISKLLFLSLILLTTCIDPINIVTEGNEGVLVVDGLITDQPGPYTVRLSNTSNYVTLNGNQIRQVIGAQVKITDNEGTIEVLEETSSGTYQTKDSGIQGIIGNTYTLDITLPDGSQFQSEPQLLNAVDDIDSIYFEFEQRTKFDAEGNEVPDDGFNIMADVSNVTDDDFYLWKWSGVYEILTSPKDRTKPGPNFNSPPRVPDPPNCSGYILAGGIVTKVCDDCCTCCNCWVELTNNQFHVATKTAYSNNKLKRVPIAFVPVDNRIFYNKLYAVFDQYSLSKRTFEFWNTAKNQLESNGSIFEPSPSKIPSNILSLTEDQDVLGIFGASAIKTQAIFISKTDIPYPVQSDTMNIDCRDFGAKSISKRPIFW